MNLLCKLCSSILFHVERQLNKKLKKEFLALDIDGDGDISIQEIENLLQTIKFKLQMSDNDIKDFIEGLDENGDGSIDIEEFLNLIQSGFKREIIQKALIQRSGIRKRFEKYDKDGNGVITRDEFRRVVEDRYQSRLTPKQVDEMIIEADKDSNGSIDYDEFLKAFTYFPASK